MNKIEPKPAPTFFDFVTNTKYHLLKNSITVKEFHSKLNEYQIWLEKQKPKIQRSLLEKELSNFDNALNLANEKFELNQKLNLELKKLRELDVNTDKHLEKINKLLHNTIKKVTEDIEDGDMKFNTAISYLMILLNELYKTERISISVIEKFILLLSPLAPHISEELWERIGKSESIQNAVWPSFDPELIKSISSLPS